jgi:lysophospholipase L1-like esterase
VSPRLRGLLANLALLAASLFLFLAIVEVTLRLSDFSFVLYPEEIEFGQPNPVLLKDAFLEDDELFWVTQDYPEKLARLHQERPPLVFLGDSCTQFGRYDQELARRLEAERGVKLRYANLGVAGWTTFQGRYQLQRDVVAAAPRVVTIYYGWNDHWIGFGIEDKNVRRIKQIFSSRVSQVRLVQLFTKALVAVGTRQTAYPNRVSLVDFKDNLHAMVETTREAGIRALLLTAPTSILPGEEPEYLGTRWLRDLKDLVPLHNSYAEAVREVAAESEATLCDLKQSFDALPRDELVAAFHADGHHLSAAGDRQLAAVLHACLERQGWLDVVLPSTADGDETR